MAKSQVKKVAAGNMLVVTQTAGSSGNGPKMMQTLIGLGLGKVRAVRELQDTPSIRGMLTRVRHMVRVEEKKG